jgi:hypothetical protein
MKFAKHALTISLVLVAGGTAALANRSPAPSSDDPGTAPVVEMDPAGLSLPEYGVYIPLPTAIASAGQL